MPHKSKANLPSRLLVSLVSAALAFPVSIPLVYAQDTNSQQQTGTQKLSEAQLAALVAPIALYSDPLVAQVLMASTYPVEVAEAYSWEKENSRLKGDALNQALQQQNWDPSVKSLVSFPPVLAMLGTQLNWTQNLGDAVLAQQSDVMTAIQTLRAKAKASGALQSNSQQTVTTQGSGSSETIVIQPANPQVVYVPTYNPTVVYGGWPYPAYPPYAYYPPGYVAGTALLSFGVGMAVGAALWGGCHWGGGGGWGGWGHGWGGGNSLTINNNTYNNFNRTTNNNWSGGSRSGSSNWSADAQRRNANVGGGAGMRDAQRDQLRQNLQRGGLSGAGEHAGGERGGLSGGERSGGQSRDAEREQLRQNLSHGGLSGGDHSGGDRSGAQRSGGHKDPGGFGDAKHTSFGGGDRFGGGSRSTGGGQRGGGQRSGGQQRSAPRSGGGGEHFGGGHR